jgi:hypothetical protein
MNGEDSASGPDPTGALYLPTTGLAAQPATVSWSKDDQTTQSSNQASSEAAQSSHLAWSRDDHSSRLAWSQDDHSDEPELFEEEEQLTAQVNQPRSSFDWARWIGPLILVLVAIVVFIAMFSVVFLTYFINVAPHVDTPTPAKHLPQLETPASAVPPTNPTAP